MEKNGWSRCIMLILTGVALATPAFSQALKEGKLYLNEDGSRFVKLTLVSQIWLRSGDMNPGSTLYGYARPQSTDIGIRRYRVQFFGQITDRIFVYSQFGENNFNSISDRKLGFFVHDAAGEYMLVKQKLSLGGGLSAWGGFARFCSPSVGTILGVDAPLFLQSTNDVTDQFLRKLTVYAKGKLGKLDYRVAMADPMAFQRAATYNAAPGEVSNFSSKPAHKQWSGYFQYQFLDQEANLTPYLTGTYQGKKKVFNLGAGVEYQSQAMWHLEAGEDTVESDMLQAAVDVFYDAPAGKKGQALSVYGAFTYFNFGQNYLRNLAVMNPVNGTSDKTLLNGSGNGFPAYGTGVAGYVQVGYKLADKLVGNTTFMPYISLQHAVYERLNKPMDFIDAGVNWLLAGHTGKLTAAWQHRPLFDSAGDPAGARNAAILQYQVFFN